MKKFYILLTHFFSLFFISGQGQNVLVQIAHLPSSPAAYLTVLSVATRDSGAWLIGSIPPANLYNLKHQRTLTRINKNASITLTKIIEFPITPNFNSTSFIANACASSDGGLALCGNYNVTSTNLDGFPFFLKLDANGDTLWCRTWDSQSTNYYFSPKSVIQTKDSGFVFAGSCNGILMALVKLDKNGNKEWASIENSLNPNNAGAIACVEGEDSTLFAGGFSSYESNLSYPSIWKFTKNGQLLWGKNYVDQQTSAYPSGYVTAMTMKKGKLLCSVQTQVASIVTLHVDGTVINARTIPQGLIYYIGEINYCKLSKTTDNKIIYHSSYNFVFDSLVMPNYQTIGGGNSCILADNRLLMTDCANFNSSDLPITGNQYSITIADIENPPSNRCFSTSPLSSTQFAIRDSLFTWNIIDTGTIKPFLITYSTFSVQVSSACNLTLDISKTNSVSDLITLYPNPTNTELRISSEEINFTSVRICNLNGNLIFQSQEDSMLSEIVVDCKGLALGIYCVKIRTNTGQTICKKLSITD